MEKLCVSCALPLLALDLLLWLAQSKPEKRIESEKANRIKTNNNLHLNGILKSECYERYKTILTIAETTTQ
jgi:hypothetical protein